MLVLLLGASGRPRPVPLGRGGVVCDRVPGSAWVAVSRVVLLLVVVDHLVGSAVP